MAELAFKVKAEYDEVVFLREELARLRGEMLKVDTATEEGQRLMARLEEQYASTSKELGNLVENAAKAAYEMKDGMLGADDAAVGLMNTLKSGEATITDVFSSLNGQISGVTTALEDAKNISSSLIDEMTAKLSDLNREKNLADAQGNTEMAESIQADIVALEGKIESLKNYQSMMDETTKSTETQIQAVKDAIAAYEDLADKQANVVDLTEESANAMKSELEEALQNVLDKMSAFQDTSSGVSDALEMIKTAAARYRGKSVELSTATEVLTKSQGMLSKSTIELAKNLARIVLPANAARVAISLLTGGLGAAAIAGATILIKKLIDRYKEQKKEAEEAAEAQREMSDTIAKSAAKPIAAFEEMRRKWITLDDEMSKRDFIEENKKALDSLGLSIDGVDQAEALFISHTQDYWEAQITRARADLYRQQVQGKIARKVELEDFLENNKDAKKNAKYYDNVLGRWVWYNKENKAARDEIEQIEKDLPALEQKADSAVESVQEFNDKISGIGKDANYQDGAKRLREEWVSAKESYEAIMKDATATKGQVAEAKAKVDKAATAYKNWTGESPEPKKTGGRGGSKKADDSEQKERENAYKRYGEQIKAMIRSMEDDIAREQISAIENNEEAISKQLDLEKKMLVDKAAEIGEAMTRLFDGNVDLLNRKTIDAAKLTEKGWEDAGEGIATVFSSQYGITDSRGKEHEILVTPILPDGSVLSEQELEDYIKNVLSGADNILEADEKGLVIAVDVDADSGEKLHEMQELYYELKRMIEEYDSIKRQNFNAKSIKEITKKEWNELLSSPELEDDMEELVSQYGTYEEKRLQIHLKWLGKINAADDEHRIMYERAFAQEMMNLEASADGMLAKVFGNVLRYSKRQLQEARNIANQYRKSNPNMTPEDIERLQRAIDAIDDAEFAKKFDTGNESLSALVRNFSHLKDLQEDYREEAERGDKADKKRLEELAALIEQEQERLSIDWKAVMTNGIIKSLQTAVNVMSDIAEVTGNQKLSEAAEGLGAFAQNLSAAYEGYKSSGHWIGAIVGGVTDLAKQAYEAFLVAEAETEEMKRNAEDFAHAMKLAELIVKSTDYSSIFGTDSSGMMKAYADRSVKSLQEYQSELKKLNTKDWAPTKFTEAWEGLGKDIFLPTTGIWGNLMNISTRLSGARRDVSKEFESYQDAISRGMKGLQTMMIKTKDNSGFANFFGIQDEFTSLGDLAPEIFGKDGMLDIEKAKAFLQTNTQITDEQKKQIQNAVDLNEKYEEAREALSGFLSNIFGDMSSQLADATIEGLRRGSMIGAEELKQNMSGAVEDLQKMMVESIYARYLSKYQEEAFSILENGGGEEDLVKLYGRMFNTISETADIASKAAARFEDIAAENGFDLNRQANANATTQTYQQISETTGSAIQGGVTALRLSSEVRNQHLSIMNEHLTEMLQQQMLSTTLAEDIRNIEKDAFMAIIEIRNNTAGNLATVRNIADMVDRIEKKTREM